MVESQDRGFLWVKSDEAHVKYIEVRTGLSDTVNTEIVSVANGGELPKDTEVIVGEGKADNRADGSNPFSVKMFQSKPKE